MLQHQAGNEDSWLDLDEESDGTKTLFRLAPSVFSALASGGLLLVDELESSLHPLLGLEIVKLFNNPNSNPRNAQIVFTTHDTNPWNHYGRFTAPTRPGLVCGER